MFVFDYEASRTAILAVRTPSICNAERVPEIVWKLDYFNANFVGTGVAFNLDWHGFSPFCFLVFDFLCLFGYGPKLSTPGTRIGFYFGRICRHRPFSQQTQLRIIALAIAGGVTEGLLD